MNGRQARAEDDLEGRLREARFENVRRVLLSLVIVCDADRITASEKKRGRSRKLRTKSTGTIDVRTKLIQGKL